ncbi:MAG: HEPN domain-containing protein [Chlamydiae bacterium]|nr:HEPN domain-containing protein [Chlamydiota bacterium]MBI3277492.1 HEPN domain-containing protein [Chlamydiota bacterium]
MSVNNPWFDFADEDHHMARSALEDQIYNQVCFHSQQGVEKLLKGFLVKKGKLVRKTHSLLELMDLCMKIESKFQDFKDGFRELDKFYVVTRYPDALPGTLPEGLPNKKDATDALQFFEEVKDFMETLNFKL